MVITFTIQRVLKYNTLLATTFQRISNHFDSLMTLEEHRMHRAWHIIGILAFTQIASWESL